ncbi:hypothetical protein HYH03_012860 [Edaphochlamys debaryana]|uniref:Protein kinase domain-containing protein n=1 Tax=Edaphochlamys debaryana TaxID=47281 RepID=A0A835XUI7_9CHLO|nr:hypothetical protein HYH03_012860 [Edaphochlamys debaryana]|eukprot:KAG2488541.1 hypothetical protein HYH03_012860 [Edaphochlamys debaryana]
MGATAASSVLLLLLLIQTSTATTVPVRSARDLALALADGAVLRALIQVPFLNLTDDAFDGLSTPILITRNFTMEGDPRLPDWPLLVLTARRKMQLGAFSRIIITHLTGYRHRTDNGGRMPGADSLAPSAPGTQGALLVQLDSALLLDYCYPKAIAEKNYAGIKRPAAFPGEQRYEVSAPQVGCRTDTELLTQRCYPSVIIHSDIAMPAAEPDLAGNPAYAWYNAWLINTTGLCINLLSDACIEEFGALGCFLKQRRVADQEPSLLPWLREHHFLEGLTLGSAPADDGGSGQPQPANVTAAQGGASGSGGGGNDAGSIGIAVGVAVGGAALLAIVAAVALVVVKRRRARSAQGTKPGWVETSESSAGALPRESDVGLGQDNAAALVIKIAPEPRNSCAQATTTAPCGSGTFSDFPLAADGSQTGSQPLYSPLAPAALASGTPMAAAPSSHEDAVVTMRTPFHQSFSARALLVSGGPPAPRRSMVPTCSSCLDDEMLEEREGEEEEQEHTRGSRFTSRVVLTALRNAAYASGNSVTSGPNGWEGRNAGAYTASGALVSGERASAGTATASVEVEEGADPPEVVELLPGVLGKGAFGRVQEGRYRGELVAVKLIHAEGDAAAGDTCQLTKALAQELEVLARCQHPNIVRLLAACMEPPRPFCVLERMETSLDKVLYGKTVNPDASTAEGDAALLSLPTVLHIAREIARGLDFLHPTIMHRDLKPANCLMNDPWGASPVVKISDFGLSRLRETMLITLAPEAGTAAYLAPECFDVEGAGRLSHRADMWSFGVVLWEMLAGIRPWRGMGPVPIAIQITVHGRRLAMPPREGPGRDAARWPRRLLRLIASCWERDPMRRPAAADVVKQLSLMIEEAQNRQQP